MFHFLFFSGFVPDAASIGSAIPLRFWMTDMVVENETWSIIRFRAEVQTAAKTWQENEQRKDQIVYQQNHVLTTQRSFSAQRAYHCSVVFCRPTSRAVSQPVSL